MNSQRKNIVLWIVTGLVAALFLAGGIGKLSGQQQAVDNFHLWGLSDELRLFVGAFELVGALALILPATATLAAMGLSVIMAGAVFTHLSHGQFPMALLPLVILCALVWIGSERRDAVGKLVGAAEH